jgi:AcrR family transcriptional regulator
MTQVAGRPLRAEVFAEQGREAQMDDVARRAEVGVGTVYRHFPTKEALIDALVAEAFERLLVVAKEQAQRDDDAWDALATTLWAGAEILAGDRALSAIMTEMYGPVNVELETQLEMAKAMTVLVERAQAAGQLREDVILDDISMLMCGIGTATAKPHIVPDAWRRHLAIVIDGLRASNASETLPSS